MVLEECLNPPFDEGLFKTGSVVLFLAVLQGLALLFPVEFELHISGGGRDGVLRVY